MAVLAAPSNYTSGQQVTHTNLNAHVNDATFAAGAVDNSTTQLSAGAIIVKDAGVTMAKLESASNGQLPIGNGSGFTKATLTAGTNMSVTNASGAITLAAALTSSQSSSLANASGISQTGSAGADLVFSTANAPTVSLTAGTWLVVGSVTMQTSLAADTMWAQFYNNTDGAAFGGSASYYSDGSESGRRAIPVHGVITIASGTKVIYFKGFRTTVGAALIMGQAVAIPNGPAGYITAIQLA